MYARYTFTYIHIIPLNKIFMKEKEENAAIRHL